MKKCPTCEKTFEDSLRFCQVDGTPLVDDAPAFDPYATIVSSPAPPAPVAEPEAAATIEAAVPDPKPVAAIAEPADVLDLPSEDPLKTVYVSDAEMRDALSSEAPAAGKPVIEMTTVEELPAPEPPSFSVPDVPAPSFGEAAPPPSPFAMSDAPAEEPASKPSVFDEPPPPPPVFDEPAPLFDEAATMIQMPVSVPFEPPAPAPSFEPPPPAPVFETPIAAPVAEWTPPPAPDASWQNQPIGSNTPFQPPPAGVGQNTTLGLVSLILGIASFVCLGFLGSVPAVILGFMQRSKISNNPAEYGGGGMAMAGINLGAINIVVTVIILILYAGLIFANMR